MCRAPRPWSGCIKGRHHQHITASSDVAPAGPSLVAAASTENQASVGLSQGKAWNKGSCLHGLLSPARVDTGLACTGCLAEGTVSWQRSASGREAATRGGLWDLTLQLSQAAPGDAVRWPSVPSGVAGTTGWNCGGGADAPPGWDICGLLWGRGSAAS